MAETKHVFESEMIALPPIKMVLGEIPSPDPNRRRKHGLMTKRYGREMVPVVQRLILHLKEK